MQTFSGSLCTLQMDSGNSTDNDDVNDYEKVRQIEEAHLAESMERLIMEAYKLLQNGDMEQAESLLLEGWLSSSPDAYHQHQCTSAYNQQ